MTARTTTIRQAVWTAIENWPDTANAFIQKYKHEDFLSPEFLEGEPGPDMPSLEILPIQQPSEWILNQSQENVLFLSVRLYTKTFSVLEPEDLIEKVQAAIWRSARTLVSPATLTYTYIQEANSGIIPKQVGPVQFKTIRFGINKSVPARITTLNLEIPYLSNPLPQDV